MWDGSVDKQGRKKKEISDEVFFCENLVLTLITNRKKKSADRVIFEWWTYMHATVDFYLHIFYSTVENISANGPRSKSHRFRNKICDRWRTAFVPVVDDRFLLMSGETLTAHKVFKFFDRIPEPKAQGHAKGGFMGRCNLTLLPTRQC